MSLQLVFNPFTGTFDWVNTPGASWASLTGTPPVVSTFSNDAGYLTSSGLSGLVPYTGATGNVDLGVHDFAAEKATFTGLNVGVGGRTVQAIIDPTYSYYGPSLSATAGGGAGIIFYQSPTAMGSGIYQGFGNGNEFFIKSENPYPFIGNNFAIYNSGYSSVPFVIPTYATATPTIYIGGYGNTVSSANITNSTLTVLTGTGIGINTMTVTDALNLSGNAVVTGDVKAATYHVGTDAGIDATITTGGLVGKTITIKKGLITGFA